MNRVLLTGRLTRDPELRTLASGKTVTQFSLATNDYRRGKEYSEYHSVVTWVDVQLVVLPRAERVHLFEPRSGATHCL